MLYDVFVYTTYDPKHQSAYILEYDSRAASVGAPDLLAYLKRHVLRSKVRARDVTQEHDIWAAWHGEGTPHQDRPLKWDLARSGVIEPIWDQASWPWGSENELIRDRRAPGMGLRRLVRKDDRRECRVLSSANNLLLEMMGAHESSAGGRDTRRSVC